jgi:hypothetical protein
MEAAALHQLKLGTELAHAAHKALSTAAATITTAAAAIHVNNNTGAVVRARYSTAETRNVATSFAPSKEILLAW